MIIYPCGLPPKTQVCQLLCHVSCDLTDCSPPGSSVPEILQARILECCHSLLQGIFLTQGSKHRFPALQTDSLPSELPGKPSENVWPSIMMRKTSDYLSLGTFWKISNQHSSKLSKFKKKKKEKSEKLSHQRYPKEISELNVLWYPEWDGSLNIKRSQEILSKRYWTKVNKVQTLIKNNILILTHQF